MRVLLSIALLFLSACGYHFDTHEPIAVSIPYVIGDQEGALTNALVQAISRTPHFRYTSPDGADWQLKVKVVKDESNRIGFRYDRNPKSGELRKNIIGTENRKELAVEVSVISCCSGKTIIGPQTLKADASYDYVDPNSLQDLSFIDPQTGRRLTTIAFSLGQLDSVGSAGEDALSPVYARLAQKIVDGLTLSGNP